MHGTGTHVVHLHGYWQGADTLHTPTQIEADRFSVKSAIREKLQSSTVVVVGYGGWPDVFMAALKEAKEDPAVDVLWCFYSSDPAAIQAEYGHVLEALKPLHDRGRARLVKGIDAPRFFMDLVRACQTVRLAEDHTVLHALFRRALWNHLFIPKGVSSEGDAAKTLAEVLGDSLAIRVTIIALTRLLDKVEITGPAVNYYSIYQGLIGKHGIPVSMHRDLENKRVAAIRDYEAADIDEYSNLKGALINAGLALECYLVLDKLDGKDASTYCAKALHVVFKLQPNDRLRFWATVIEDTLLLLQ